MAKDNKQILEALLRKFIKNELRRLREADEDQEATDAEAGTEEETPETPEPAATEKPEEEKPEEQPQEEPAEEEGLNMDFQEGLDNFIQKLKSSTDPVQHEDVVNIVTDLIDSFTSGNDAKMKILSNVRDNFLA